MKKYIKIAINTILRLLPVGITCRLEFNRQKFIGFNERPLEFSFVFKSIGLLCPKKILDVGTGKTALPHLMRNCGPLVWAIDNVKDYWSSGMSNRHYVVLDYDITSEKHLQVGEKFDLISCVSVLEHIKDHDQAIKNMFELLNDEGHLVITCPYTDDSYHENVYEIPESNAYGRSIPFVCQSYSNRKVENWLKQNRGKIIEQEFWQCWSGKYWTTGDKINPPVRVEANQKHQLICLLIKKCSDDEAKVHEIRDSNS